MQEHQCNGTASKMQASQMVLQWLSVIDNYKTVNVENALQDENSVFYHYQKLIRMRKEYKVIQNGLYIPYCRIIRQSLHTNAKERKEN